MMREKSARCQSALGKRIALLWTLTVCLGCQGLPATMNTTIVRAQNASSLDDGASGEIPAQKSEGAPVDDPRMDPVRVSSDKKPDGDPSQKLSESVATSSPTEGAAQVPPPTLFNPGLATDWWNKGPMKESDWLEDRPWSTLWSDQRNFYSRSNLPGLVGGFTAAAVLANSSMDSDVSQWYQTDVRNEFTNDVSAWAKPFGEQWQVIPLYLAVSLIGRAGYAGLKAQEWADRSFRSMLVGVPPLLLAQKMVGSSRPGESSSSDWSFWSDNNGVSGHAFVGAIPFLIAAQLSDRAAISFVWTMASTLPAWSRINDNDHYLSQAVLGWWLAHIATRGMDVPRARTNSRIVPWSDGETVGMGIEIRR